MGYREMRIFYTPNHTVTRESLGMSSVVLGYTEIVAVAGFLHRRRDSLRFGLRQREAQSDASVLSPRSATSVRLRQVSALR